jgi:hypothetical protein
MQLSLETALICFNFWCVGYIDNIMCNRQGALE